MVHRFVDQETDGGRAINGRISTSCHYPNNTIAYTALSRACHDLVQNIVDFH